MDFGWWDDYVINLSYKNYLYTQAPIVKMPTPRVSVQAQWMVEKLSIDKTNPALAPEMSIWKKRAGTEADFKALVSAYETRFQSDWREGDASTKMVAAGKARMFEGMADSSRVKLSRGYLFVDSVVFTDEVEDRYENEDRTKWYQIRNRTQYVAMPQDMRIMCGPKGHEAAKPKPVQHSAPHEPRIMAAQETAMGVASGLTSLEMMNKASAL